MDKNKDYNELHKEKELLKTGIINELNKSLEYDQMVAKNNKLTEENNKLKINNLELNNNLKN
jgi:hypothetical protein